MADYKNIPVDDETYQMLLELCAALGRKQGAQVKILVKAAYEKWMAGKEKQVSEPTKGANR